MDSFSWEPRTVLASSIEPPLDLQDGQSDRINQAADAAATSSRKLSAIDVWNYLMSLTAPDDENDKLSRLLGQIKHFHPSDFERGWDAAPSRIGSGVSYNVDRYRLTKPAPDGSPVIVAVKRLNLFRDSASGGKLDSTTLQRSVATALKELRILTHLPLIRHKNLVALLGFRSELGQNTMALRAQQQDRSTDISLVMEWAPHGTLQDYLLDNGSEGRISLLQKAHLMHHVSKGLEALHECEIAHGDLKMDNILVFDGPGGEPVAKLSDFGHALVDLGEENALEQRYLGTPLTNAPELRPRGESSVLAGLFKATSADDFYKCDMYSFGLVVWEILLCGRRFYKALGTLYHGEDDGSLILQFLNTLHKDELLLRALMTLEEVVKGEEERVISGLISRVLCASLRDDPADRQSATDICAIFSEQQPFAEPEQSKPRGLYAMLESVGFCPLLPWETRVQGFLDHRSDLKQMPRAVQEDLVQQLKLVVETAPTETDQRSALFDLAICSLKGIGSENVTSEESLAYLERAAQLGSVKASALAPRLHAALGINLPAHPWGSMHPTYEAEARTSSLASKDYFVQRLRKHEEIFRYEMLTVKFDIYDGCSMLFSDIYLTDLDSLLAEEEAARSPTLKCKAKQDVLGEAPEKQSLISVAARLGLLGLVRLISENDEASKVIAEDYSLLSAACRGGHLEMIKLLTSHGASAGFYHRGNPLHWLAMFPDDEVEQAFDLIPAKRAGKNAFEDSVVFGDLGVANITITPLEAAIATNNIRLVELFISRLEPFEAGDPLGSIGWTEKTFDLAVSLLLYDLISNANLVQLELLYRKFRKAFAATARYRLSEGLPEMAPFGLFGIASPPDPFLPLLLHGENYKSAVNATIDVVLASGTCSINDKDVKGSTALTNAAVSTECVSNLEIVTALISRGATFGQEEDKAHRVTSKLGSKRGQVNSQIIHELLKSGLLPATTKSLVNALYAGNYGLVEAIVSFEQDGSRLDVNSPFVDEDGESTMPLFFAISTEQSAQMVRLLLDAGARIDAIWDGRTPLDVAISFPICNAETIDMLISRGAPLVHDGVTILHHAVGTKSRVNDRHVTFHLLEHRSIRALIDDIVLREEYMMGVTPLHMACYVGNIEAVAALLQAGAKIPEAGGVQYILDIAVGVGRRPQKCIAWRGDMDDEKSVYKWRRDIENIIFDLLNKTDSGHGRTKLHIAAQLGNYPRVVELIEHGGCHAFAGDRDNKLPISYVETEDELEEGDDESYTKTIEKLVSYLQSKLIEEVGAAGDDLQAVTKVLSRRGPLNTMVSEEREAIEDIEKLMDRLKIREDELETCVGDGRSSPAEREIELTRLIEQLKERHGPNDLRTLRATGALCTVYYLLDRAVEAEEMNSQVLEAKQAIKPDDELWEDRIVRVFFLCIGGKAEEAQRLAAKLHEKATATFGDIHPITLSALTKLALAYEYLDENMFSDRAFATQKKAYEGYQTLFDEASYQGTEHRSSFFELRCDLALNYCSAGETEKAKNLVRSATATLEFVQPRDFVFLYSLLTSHLAPALESYGLIEEAEQVYLNVLHICEKKHGWRKSWCVEMALRRLSRLYRSQNSLEKEQVIIQQLLDRLKSTRSTDDQEIADIAAVLGSVFASLGRVTEASLLQAQAVEIMERSPKGDHTKLLEIRLRHCTSLNQQGQNKEAASICRGIFKECLEKLGEDHTLTVQVMRALASFLKQAGDFTEAKDVTEEWIDVLVRTRGEKHRDTSEAVLLLCGILKEQDLIDEAEIQAERHLSIVRQMDDSDAHQVAEALYALADCKQRLGNFDEAESLFTESLEMERKYCGGHNSDALWTMRTLATLFSEAVRYDKAEPLLRRILEIAPSVTGNLEDTVSFCQNLLGQICLEDGRSSEAIQFLEQALISIRSSDGENSESTISYMSDVVTAYLTVEDWTAAKSLALKVVEYQRSNLGNSAAETILAKMNLSQVYIGLSMWPEAETIQREIVASLERAPDKDDKGKDIGHYLQEISYSCQKQGRYRAAEEHARRALKTKLGEWGEGDRISIRSHIDLAYILNDADKMQEAESVANEAYTIAMKHLEEDDEIFDGLEELRACIYYEMGNFIGALDVQQRVVARDPKNPEELLFISKILAKLQRVPEAIEAAKDALDLREGGRGEEKAKGQSNHTTAEALQDLTDLYVADQDWAQARTTGERARGITDNEKSRGSYEDETLHLQVLKSLKPVYGALKEEEKLIELELEIRRMEAMRKRQRQEHAQSIAWKQQTT